MYSYGILNSEVKKHPIQLILEEFAQVCKIPYNNHKYGESEEGNDLNFDLAANSFLNDQTFVISNPFTVGLILLNIRVIHYTMNHVLFLRKGNSNHINKSDISPVCFLVNRVEKIGLMESYII